MASVWESCGSGALFNTADVYFDQHLDERSAPAP
jgi:hypothetical protein